MLRAKRAWSVELGGSGLSGRGRGQPGRPDHPPGQAQELERSAAQMAQTQAGGGAGHRALEARQRHGSLLAARRHGRCAACGAVRGGYNIRWLLRAIVRLGLKGLFAPLFVLIVTLAAALATALGASKAGVDRSNWAVA